MSIQRKKEVINKKTNDKLNICSNKFSQSIRGKEIPCEMYFNKLNTNYKSNTLLCP